MLAVRIKRLDLYIDFLIIENKFSKHGYHNNKIIKYGDILLFKL